MQRLIVAAVACTLAALAFVFRPLAPSDLPNDARALTFVDRNGLPLGTILGRDDRHTIAVPLAAMAPAFLSAIVAIEDRRFAHHGALDPLAVARSFAGALREGHLPRGASTLSMQLARLLVPVPPNVWGKLQEAVIAQRLENGFSKAQILEAYANRVPMGSDVYGVEAAARTYFGIDAAHLDLAQATLLAALPNAPALLDPYEHLAAARARQRLVLARMRADGDIDAAAERTAANEHLSFVARGSGIVAAAHALFFLAPRVAPERERVRTTLDRPLQLFVERQLRDVLSSLANDDVRQGAALVIDNRTGEVLAYVGSRDYFADDDAAKNDGVQALRQPGSTLKPFLYELALERRVIRPTTILADVPVAYALPGARLYAPTDYARHFAGPVRVRLALANSLNVPAVRVLEGTGVPSFLDRLHALGFARLRRAPSFYGLGLTLGGGEVSLFELARAYAELARGGAPVALAMTLDGAAPPELPQGAAPGDPAWALITDILADPIARSASFGANSILSLPFAAAVKTGTSSDFRDTWTVGFSCDYTVAVWVGNFDGHPMRGISGVTGAGPLWSRIMLHLHEQHEPAAFEAPAGYARERICATTGAPPSADCPAVVSEWLDRADRARYAAERGVPRDRSPFTDTAYDAWLVSQPERTHLATRILFPHDGDRFVASTGGLLKVELAGQGIPRVTLDGRTLRPRNGDFLIPLLPGRYGLAVKSASDTPVVNFTVSVRRVRIRPGFSVVPAARDGYEP